MDFSVGRITAFLIASATLWAAPAQAQATFAADALVDSVGVNVHLHFDNTLYKDNFPLVYSRLVELGLRHVRDGLIDTTSQYYYDRHNTLGRSGIKGVFIAMPGQTATLFAQYPTRMRDSFEAYEALNEYNQSGDPNWVAVTRATLAQLHGLRSNPALAVYPVYGPSISRHLTYPELGDVSSLIDYANLHNYYSAFNPGTTGWGSNGYGSIDWNLNQVKITSGNKPVVTTETGYRYDIPHGDAVTPELGGKYMPRLVLEQFRKGIHRSYIYELVDSPSAQSWSVARGLLYSNGTPKPAFLAVKGLLSLLKDPGPAFTVQPLSYSLAGGTVNLRQMTFQKRDGTYLLALWVELPGYDVNAKTIIDVPAQAVTITVHDDVNRPIQTHRWQDSGVVTTSAVPNGPTSLAINITDLLTIVEFRAVSSLPSSPTNLRILP